jgi:UDPglucose 6-dehydrogenase
LNPEFVLIGSDTETSSKRLESFYSFIDAPKKLMKIESAELTKVAYNTFIGFKIVFANTLAEITAAVGGNVDEVSSALSGAHSRLMSSKYLYAGMGDGGGCHPRDQIAMSHLAKSLELSVNTFDWLARARDSQAQRQAKELSFLHSQTSLKVILLGEAYKKNINLTIGSPAKLLAHFLEDLQVKFEFFDPIVNPAVELEPNIPAIYFVSCNHDVFKNLEFPPGSIVVDPWGDAVKKHQHGVTFVRKGRN